MDEPEFEVRNEDKVVGPVTLSTLQQGWYQGLIPVNSEARLLGTGPWYPVPDVLKRFTAVRTQDDKPANKASDARSRYDTPRHLPPVTGEPYPAFKYVLGHALPGETTLTGRPGVGILVTSQRVVVENSSFGAWSRSEILIEDVSYVGVESSSSPVAAIFAAIALLVAAYLWVADGFGAPTWVAVVVGLALLLVFLSSRRSRFVVASSGGKIVAWGLANESARQVFESITTARLRHAHASPGDRA